VNAATECGLADFYIPVVRYVLGAIFLVAAGGKFLNVSGVALALGDSSSSNVQRRLLHTGVILLAVGEFALGLWLLGAEAHRPPLSTAAGVLAVFTIYLIFRSRREGASLCGCFGGTSQRVGHIQLGRNGVLLAMAVVGAGGPVHSLCGSLPLWSASAATISTAIVTFATLTIVYALMAMADELLRKVNGAGRKIALVENERI
jgi:hypothetical protein